MLLKLKTTPPLQNLVITMNLLSFFPKGLSVQSKTIFRIVTSLAPPFVMQSELDEDGLCLRGLPCHRLSPSAPHNLTLMFNAIETRDRFEEDAMEHGMKSPPQEETSSYDHSMYM